MPIPLFQISSLGLGAPLSWLPLDSQRSRCMAKRKGVFEHNISNSSLSSDFSCFFFFLFCFVFFFKSIWYGCLDIFVMGLSWLL